MGRNEEALEHFGSMLMKHVRDRSIREWKQMIDGQMGGEIADAVRDRLSPLDEDARQAMRQLVPTIVDRPLHHFLWMLEDWKAIEVTIQIDGEAVSLRTASNEAGEGLVGDLYDCISRFSTEPSWNHPDRGDGQSMGAPPIRRE